MSKKSETEETETESVSVSTIVARALQCQLWSVQLQVKYGLWCFFGLFSAGLSAAVGRGDFFARGEIAAWLMVAMCTAAMCMSYFLDARANGRVLRTVRWNGMMVVEGASGDQVVDAYERSVSVMLSTLGWQKRVGLATRVFILAAVVLSAADCICRKTGF